MVNRNLVSFVVVNTSAFKGIKGFAGRLVAYVSKHQIAKRNVEKMVLVIIMTVNIVRLKIIFLSGVAFIRRRYDLCESNLEIRRLASCNWQLA